jgi:hypothetical protein
MKILTVIFALILLASLPAFSQGLSLGIGADVSFPLDQLADKVQTGYGATGLVKFGLIPLIDLTGGVEYLKFTTKSITVNGVTGDASADAWGVIIGGRVNIIPLLYAGLEVGTYSFTTSLPGSTEKVTHGVIIPMVGGKLGPLDLSARYVPAGTDSFWGLRGMFWL